MTTSVGAVVSLSRFPLKSAAPERLSEVDVIPTGLRDDRRWALARDGAPVPGKLLPALADVPARVVDDRLQVRFDGRWHQVTDRPTAELTSRLGPELDLLDMTGSHEAQGQPLSKVAAVHLVSVGAATAPQAPTGCDPDPRANIVLQLGRPGSERGWVGRRLALGDVELEVAALPRKCLGVYCTVVRPGTLRVGSPACLLP